MNYILHIDTLSNDKRVHELASIAKSEGWLVAPFNIDENFNGANGVGKVVNTSKDESRKGIDESADALHKACKSVYFFAPRFVPDFDLPAGSVGFGYSKNFVSHGDSGKYVCLSDDDLFVKENNFLTALAQKELLLKRFGHLNMKVLIIGYGKLTAELEKVLCDADIHILNFNHHKIEDLKVKYGEKAFFENAPLHEFPVIINTVPKQVVKVEALLPCVIYELASPPYGFDFGNLNVAKFDYNIEAALPGRFFPDKAARAVFDAVKRSLCDKKSIVLCLTASPCSYNKMIPILEGLCDKFNVIPVMSENALKTNRFLDIDDFKNRLKQLCGNNIITTIAGCEILSSRKDVVASVVVPATGNTIAKLANAVTDTPVCMAVKALLRNGKPCIVGISTNDALSGNASNIGLLLNRKNYYFVPFGQDDVINKPFSLLCDFNKTAETIESALNGKQLQPIIL